MLASPPPVLAPVATTAAAATEKPRATTVIAEPAPATVSSLGPVPQNPPVASPATPLMAERSMMAPPDAAAGKLIEPERAGEDRYVGADTGNRCGRWRRCGGGGDSSQTAANRVRRRCRRGQFGRWPARAVARPLEVEVECVACDLAADHRGEGRLRRPRPAVAAGRRTAAAMRRPQRKSAPRWSTTSAPARPRCSTASAFRCRATSRPPPPSRRRASAAAPSRSPAAAPEEPAKKPETSTLSSLFKRG